jgi:Domain of unknown function (DUF4252)
MIVRTAIASLALLATPSLLAADIGRLKLPDFRHLQVKATESVDISIGPMMLWLAAHLAPERDEDGTEIRSMLKGIEAVYVRSYQFDEDGAYSKDDIDSVRRQLRDEKWQPLAEIRSKRNDENVDIFIAIENDKPAGFAILASEPREFTIVNVVGTIDPQHIGQLQRNLDLPGGSRRLSTIND